MFRIFLFLTLIFAAISAFADTVNPTYDTYNPANSVRYINGSYCTGVSGTSSSWEQAMTKIPQCGVFSYCTGVIYQGGNYPYGVRCLRIDTGNFQNLNHYVTNTTCNTGYSWNVQDGVCKSDLGQCPDGYIYIQDDQMCHTEVDCTAGQTKTLLVKIGQLSKNEFQLVSYSATTDNLTVSNGGCTYSIDKNFLNGQMADCQTVADNQTDMYCRAYATTTGGYSLGDDDSYDAALVDQEPQTASDCPAGTTFTENRCKVNKSSNNCIRTRTGDEICNSTAAVNEGIVNGVKVKVGEDGTTVNGYPAAWMDGIPIADTQNANNQVERCVTTASGEPLCINLPTVDCDENGTWSFGICSTLVAETDKTKKVTLTKDVNEKTTTSSQVNPDGTTTVTETKTTDIRGSTPNIITTTYNENNVQISQTTQKGNLYPTGTGTANTDQSSSGENSGLCPDGQSLQMGTCSGTVYTPGALNTEPGEGFGEGYGDSELAAAQAEFTDAFNDIKDEISSMFDNTLTSGVSQLPSWNFGEVKGVQANVDWNNYSGPLSGAGSIIVAVAYLFGLGSLINRGD